MRPASASAHFDYHLIASGDVEVASLATVVFTAPT